MDLGLRGKRAIVTGGSRGIGLATARALAADGADVALVARSEPDLRSAVDSIRCHGVRVLYASADTRDQGSVDAMTADLVQRLGGVDILVNAAAASR